MADIENGRAHVESGISFAAALRKSLVPILVWLVGLASTIYLVVQAFVILFFSIMFINYATPDFNWHKVADVVLSAVPLCCFALIGFVGLRFWPHGRFRLWGLSAIVLQTAAAIYFYTSPDGHFIFFDLIRWARP